MALDEMMLSGISMDAAVQVDERGVTISKCIIEKGVHSCTLGCQLGLIVTARQVVHGVWGKARREARLPLLESVLNGVGGGFEFGPENSGLRDLAAGDGRLQFVLEGEEVREAVNDGPESGRHA